MTDLKWFDQYTGQSTDELIALYGDFRTDSLVLAFEKALQYKAKHIGTDPLSDEERVILVIEALEREVNSGGYDSYLRNASHVYAPIVVDALEKIGCTTVATITRDAFQALEITGDITAEAIERVMEKDSDERDAKLAECDDRYYTDAGDLAEPLWAFIIANSSKIHLLTGYTQLSSESPSTSKRWWELWK